jgi:hypothetical protein
MILLLLHFGLLLTLPAQDEPVTVELDLDVLFGEAGQLGLQHEGIIGLMDIDRRHPCPSPPGALFTIATSESLVE